LEDADLLKPSPERLGPICCQITQTHNRLISPAQLQHPAVPTTEKKKKSDSYVLIKLKHPSTQITSWLFLFQERVADLKNGLEK